MVLIPPAGFGLICLSLAQPINSSEGNRAPVRCFRASATEAAGQFAIAVKRRTDAGAHAVCDMRFMPRPMRCTEPLIVPSFSGPRTMIPITVGLLLSTLYRVTGFRLKLHREPMASPYLKKLYAYFFQAHLQKIPACTNPYRTPEIPRILANSVPMCRGDDISKPFNVNSYANC